VINVTVVFVQATEATVVAELLRTKTELATAAAQLQLTQTAMTERTTELAGVKVRFQLDRWHDTARHSAHNELPLALLDVVMAYLTGNQCPCCTLSG
jgi:hypothetical protein